MSTRTARRGSVGAMRRLLQGVAAGTPGYRTNYVLNPSFEVVDTPGLGGQRYGSATFARDTSEKQHGAASLKVTSSAAVDSGQWESMDLAAGTYTASAWIKTSGVSNAHFVTRDPSYNDLGTGVHVSGTTAWARQSITFTLAAPTTVQMLIGLGSYGSTSSGTAWFDGLMVEQASTAGSYFDGGLSVGGATVGWSGAANASPSTEKRSVATVGLAAQMSASSATVVSLTPTTATTVSMANLYKAPQNVDNFVGANPDLAVIANQPQARWVNTQGDADNLGALISAAAGKTAIICIYAIPGRDNGQYSAGGFPDRASYLTFCQTVKTKIGNAPAFIFYEPDALGLTNGLNASLKAERIETLRQGVGILATIPNAETYIDASKWISPSDQAGLQAAVDIAKVAGIVMNVSGYDSMDSCYSYGEAVLSELANRGITGKKYVIDSGRNGVGPLTDADRPLATPWLDTSQAWCNPPKRRLGPTPQVPSGKPNCRALMWVKNPGESDGTFPSTSNSTYYGENAPSAGAFWLVQAKMLAGTEPGGGGGAAPVGTGLSMAKADFTSDYGAFTDRSAGVSLVSGRARLVANTTYANISTPGSYTLKDSSIYARLYAPAASGAQTSVLQFIVRSVAAADGTRLNLEINTVTGKLTIANDSGYYDANAVSITYDPVAHAYARWREASGTTYLETSPDTGTWTVRRTLTTPSWLTSTANQSAQFVAYKDAGAAAYAEVDNVNSAAGAATGALRVSALRAATQPEPPFVIGSTKPDATNTGVAAGTTLTDYTGEWIITTPGTVIQNRRVYGRILVRAADVTIRNTEVIGRWPSGRTGGGGVIDCNHVDAKNVLIERCTIHNEVPSLPLGTGIIGHDYTSRRNHVYEIVDYFGVYNSNTGYTDGPTNVVIEGCYAHDLCFMSPDPGQSDNRTHNDGIQIQGGTGTVVRGNALYAIVSDTFGDGGSTSVPAPNPFHPYWGSVVVTTPNVSACTGLLIEKNWIYGGYRGVAFAANKFGAQNVGTVRNNRFGRDRAIYTIDGVRNTKDLIFLNGQVAENLSGTSTQFSDTSMGNVYDDDGSPVLVQFRTTV